MNRWEDIPMATSRTMREGQHSSEIEQVRQESGGLRVSAPARWREMLLVTLAVGIPASLLSLVIWPPAPGGPVPTMLQTALFLIVFAAEGLLFGFGVAFACFGFPLVRRAARVAVVRAWPAFISITWTLLSWWPHDGMHRASGVGDLNAVLRIDYVFHLTLI